MAEPSQLPLPAGAGRQAGDGRIGRGGRQTGDGRIGRGGRQAGGGRGHPLAALVVVCAVIAGTAVLGVATGFLWAALAPRALAVVIGRDSASVVNPETSAFIAADGWFTLLTVGGGLVTGLLGYALAVRRHGALAMAGLIGGGLAAALIAKWIGQHSGSAGFNHGLAAGRPGTLLRLPLMLGGHGPLAFWPLAAGLTAGVIELAALLRDRRRRPAPLHAGLPAGQYGPASEAPRRPAGPRPGEAADPRD